MPKTNAKPKKIDFTLEVYLGNDDKWYWRWSRAGRKMANSDQGYSRRVDCVWAAAMSQGLVNATLRKLIDNAGQNPSGRLGLVYRSTALGVTPTGFQTIAFKVTP